MSTTVEERLFQQRIKEYSDRLETRSELIGELRESLDIANDVLEKHRLRKLVEHAETEREQIIEALRKLELENEREQIQREKKDLIQQAGKHERAKSYKDAIDKWRMVYTLDPQDPDVEKEIKRLEEKLQCTQQSDSYITQLTRRISEIKSIYREVVERLRRMDETGEEDDTLLLIVEQFVQQRVPADAFMEAWKALEKKPSKISADQQPNYAVLAQRLSRGEVILFLGSDIPQLSGITELELEKLIQELADKAGYNNFTGSLPMIAQYYEMSDYGRSSLVRNLNTLIEERNIPEIKIYKLLAKIEQPLILVSATYDMFLENCFSEAHKKYAVISSVICSRDNCRIDDATVNLKAGQVIVRYSDQGETRVLESGQELSMLEDLKNYSLIYKIRGYCDSVEQGAWQDTWTLTEENYFDFARNIGNSIPAYIVRQFLNRIVYFAGYSTRSWEDRLLISLILNLTRYDSAKVITQTEDSFELAYWRWKKVDIYSVDLENFASQLESYLP